MSSETPEIEKSELQRRVIYSLLRPAARLARRFDVGLLEMKEWIELVYYHELKEEGLTLEQAASVAQVSRRKVAQLSKRLKLNFFTPEQKAALPRRIEFMLWAGPMTEGRIRQALSEVDAAEVDAAIEQLIAEERVNVEGGRTRTLTVPKSEFRLYAKNWIARVDGLNNQLSSLTNTVLGRFFREDDRAFQRSLDFRIRDEDLPELRRLYEDVIFPRLAEFDELARDEDGFPIGFSIHWAPNYTDEES